MFRVKRAAVRALSNAFAPCTASRVARPRMTIRETLATSPSRSFAYLRPRFAEEKSADITESEAAQASSSTSSEPSGTSSTIEDDQALAATSETTDQIEAEKSEEPSADSLRRPKKDELTTVFVARVDYNADVEDFRQFVSSYGKITDLHLPKDPSRGLKGFGFIKYSTPEEANSAIDNLHDAEYLGRRLSVTMAKRGTQINRRSSQKEPSRTIFLGNLSYDISDKELSDLFRDIKDVVDVRLAVDRGTGQCRGFAHADFSNVEAALAAREQLEGSIIQGRKLRIDFAAASER